MMARVVVTAPADADMANILADLADEAGSLVASKYNLMFERLYDRLAGHPESCPTRPKLGAHIRVAVVFPYLVIYQHPEGGDTVSIVRVLHGRRKITRRLLREE
jgi:toxin ParE1/3/4